MRQARPAAPFPWAAPARTAGATQGGMGAAAIDEDRIDLARRLLQLRSAVEHKGERRCRGSEAAGSLLQ